jgi:hypothetical protein
MSDSEQKPLNWMPDPSVGYFVARRSDGGMNITFTNASAATLAHWRQFALEHLLGSDRLTRNLYDLRQIAALPAEAIRIAMEVSGDPSVRNIRLAIVVANEDVRQAIRKIADLTTPNWMEAKTFTDLDEAETWLSRPLTLLV